MDKYKFVLYRSSMDYSNSDNIDLICIVDSEEEAKEILDELKASLTLDEEYWAFFHYRKLPCITTNEVNAKAFAKQYNNKYN